MIKLINKNVSLILLKINALKLDDKVPVLFRQKLISKNEVNPISSQPIIRVKKLLPKIKKIMLNINQFNNNINSSCLSSYLK
jgi:hypothetical protein